eukprot:jgi/Mesvir1/4838/Mv11119-RA.1
MKDEMACLMSRAAITCVLCLAVLLAHQVRNARGSTNPVRDEMAREDDGIAMMPAGMPGIGEEHAREPDSQTVEATWLWRYAEFHKERLGKPGTRYLVYQCTGRAANPREACGGLGDRFSGIVSTLYLAVVTNRVFLIDYSYPAPLIDSLLPNAIDWHSNASVMDQGTPLIFNVDKETESTRSLVARCQGDEPAIVIRAAWARWCLYLWSPALSAELRQMYSMGFPHPVFGTWHLWDDNKRPYDMYFTWAFDFLFRRSPALDAAVDRLRSSMGLPQPGQGPWVGVHMRFGKQEGWNDTVVMISKGQLNRTLDQLTRAVVVSIRQLHFICGGMDHGLGRASVGRSSRTGVYAGKQAFGLLGGSPTTPPNQPSTWESIGQMPPCRIPGGRRRMGLERVPVFIASDNMAAKEALATQIRASISMLMSAGIFAPGRASNAARKRRRGMRSGDGMESASVDGSSMGNALGGMNITDPFRGVAFHFSGPLGQASVVLQPPPLEVTISYQALPALHVNHVDMNRTDAHVRRVAAIDTFAEWWLLAEATCIVRTTSGFSYTAVAASMDPVASSINSSFP